MDNAGEHGVSSDWAVHTTPMMGHGLMFDAERPPHWVDHNTSRHVVDTDLAVALGVSASISILSCIWVLFIILLHRLYHIQSRRFLLHTTIANLLYTVYWVLPRFPAHNLVTERYGGASCECAIGSACHNAVCYLQAMLHLFAFSCIAWETFLVAYSSYCALTSARGISVINEAAFSVLCWGIGLCVATGSIISCQWDSAAGRLHASAETDRYLGFGALAMLALCGALATYLYFFKIRAYLALMYKSLFPDSDEMLFWNNVQRRVRTTLYTVRMADVVATIRPVVYLPFAFLLLSIPILVYVVWSEVEPDTECSETRKESIVKGICFNLLALRGFFCVFVMFMLDRDNRLLCRASAIKKAFLKALSGSKRRVMFSNEHRVRNFSVMHDEEEDAEQAVHADDAETQVLSSVSREQEGYHSQGDLESVGDAARDDAGAGDDADCTDADELTALLPSPTTTSFNSAGAHRSEDNMHLLQHRPAGWDSSDSNSDGNGGSNDRSRGSANDDAAVTEEGCGHPELLNEGALPPVHPRRRAGTGVPPRSQSPVSSSDEGGDGGSALGAEANARREADDGGNSGHSGAV